VELRINDIVELLQVSHETVYRWIKEDRLPAYKIHNQFRFNKAEIKEWVLKNNIEVSGKILDIGESRSPVSLTQLLERGRILHEVEGAGMIEAIKSAVSLMPLPPGTSRDEIVLSLLEREEMMPTATGKGIAIPHPRNPIVTDPESESVTMGLLKKGIRYGSVDDKPVHTIFIVLSAKPTRHLEILSRISFLCQHQEFLGLLESRAQEAAIMSHIRAMEKEWERTRGLHE
jgi:PTS system nitrogen regulatory IIA component